MSNLETMLQELNLNDFNEKMTEDSNLIQLAVTKILKKTRKIVKAKERF